MRLLLAEDEKELSNALVAILKHNNYEVDAVYNGEDALNFIENVDYDGVILDIMMPKIDGITVLKKVRDQKNDVPILMLTAKTEIDDMVLGLDSGADDYLSKPFVTKELLARIRAITRRKNKSVSAILQYGNMRLNCTNFELTTDAGTIRLQNREFQMLEMLMANPSQLISTERFMEKIWGYNNNAEINVVWVYVSYLRKKLGSLKANVKIKAVRNQGYMLEEE